MPTRFGSEQQPLSVLAFAIERPAEEMVIARVHVSLNVFSVSDSLGPRLLGEDARLDTFH